MISKDNIISVLMVNNPWLTGKSFNIKDFYPQPRFQLDALTNTLIAIHRRHAVVTGLRRVGKTTLMKHAIDWLLSKGIPSGNIFYIPCDHPLMESAEIPDIIEAVETNFSPQGTWYLFIDEVHLTKNWNKWLKVIYDQNQYLRIVVTGSANPALVRGITDSGLGRWYEINLPTMSFSEYCYMRKVDLIKLPQFPTDMSQLTLPDLLNIVENTKQLQPLFINYIHEGGFPERCGTEDLSYMNQLLYDDLFITMMRRDLVRYLAIRKIDAFTRLFRYMIKQTAQITNISNIAKEIGNISKDTVSEYLDHFCAFGLLYKAEMTDKSGTKILKTQPKYHITDPALYAIFHPDPLADQAAAGNLVESIIFKHVADAYSKTGGDLGYLRDQANRDKEIDVVFKRNDILNFIEVKYQNNAKLKDTDALANIAGQKPESNFIFLTKNSSDTAIQKRKGLAPIILLPVHTFVYWIG
jgi:uncharacterized protein